MCLNENTWYHRDVDTNRGYDLKQDHLHVLLASLLLFSLCGFIVKLHDDMKCLRLFVSLILLLSQKRRVIKER